HTTNLHKVWDTDLVLEAISGLSLADYTARLTRGLSTETQKKYAQGQIEDWILESHTIAREKAYKDNGVPIPMQAGHPHSLSATYISDGAGLVEVQLTKGGVRLAQCLNDTFKD